MLEHHSKQVLCPISPLWNLMKHVWPLSLQKETWYWDYIWPFSSFTILGLFTFCIINIWLKTHLIWKSTGGWWVRPNTMCTMGTWILEERWWDVQSEASRHHFHFSKSSTLSSSIGLTERCSGHTGHQAAGLTPSEAELVEVGCPLVKSQNPLPKRATFITSWPSG